MDLKAFVYFRTYKIRNLYYALKKRLPVRTVFLCDMDPRSIPAGTIFPHPFGIVIQRDVKIGKNVVILHGVTVGVRDVSNPIQETVVIGDNAIVGCNATILGKVKVGNSATIGAHALVLHDVPDGQTVYGVW